MGRKHGGVSEKEIAPNDPAVIPRAEFDDEDPEAVDAEPTGNLDETYAQAKTRQARAAADREEFNRDIFRVQRDQLRGTLVTKKEATAAAAEVRDAFMGLGKQLWPRVDGALPDAFPASQRQQMALALKAAWDSLLSELSL